MALSKIIAEGVDLTDTFAFTGTVTGAGDVLDATTTVPSEGGAATTNLVQGLAKAWMSLNSTGTPSIRDSLNISSVTDHLVGSQTGETINSFAGTDNMAPTASAWNNLSSSGKYAAAAGIRNSSSYWVGAFWSTTSHDVIYNSSSVHGDLA